jgi:CDP-2,3-bis-(O-geranylgeranyl)-sn-glycerol synthase
MPTLFIVVQALWAFLPAYVANMVPVVAAKLMPGWDAPIDGGRMHRDGRRVMGASKTWRGVVAGGVVGAAVAAAQSLVHTTDWALTDFAYAATGSVAGPLTIGLLLGLGAGAGDAVKSYFKRRTGRQGGAPWIPFDQLDFVLFGLLFAFGASTLLWMAGAQEHWLLATFVYGDGWIALLVLVIVTPGLHFLVNMVGYKLGLKKVPW